MHLMLSGAIHMLTHNIICHIIYWVARKQQLFTWNITKICHKNIQTFRMQIKVVPCNLYTHVKNIY